MADSTLDSEFITLEDNWPGVARILGRGQVPQGDITGSGHHNVETAIHKAGEKLTLFNDGASAGISGLSTFVYLQVGTQNADVAIAAKTVCVPGSATVWYQVGNNPDTDIVLHTGSALAAVALSVMTDAYWGWFWCGGVCPEALVSGLGGNYLTDGTVIVGSIVAHNLVADAIGLGACGADTEHSIGMSLAIDVA